MTERDDTDMIPPPPPPSATSEQMLPPAPENSTPKTVREEREAKNVKELLIEILEVTDTLLEWRKDVDEWRKGVDERFNAIDGRLAEGDGIFTQMAEHNGRALGNIGLAMNAVKELCELRGLERRAEELGVALDVWGKDMAETRNAKVHEEPTHPSNPIPPPPQAAE